MKNITLTVDDETYRRARMRAAEENTSVSGLVKRLLSEETSVRATPSKETLLNLMAQLRTVTEDRPHTPAEYLQREGREER